MRAHSPTCGPNRNAQVMGEHEYSGPEDDESMPGRKRFRILKCAGCETVYFQKEWLDDWDWVPDPASADGYSPIIRQEYWPSASVKSFPAWLDDFCKIDWPLFYLLLETYRALNEGLEITAALGMRTAFDRASELLGVDPKLPFAKKLSELEQDGHIGKSEKISCRHL